MCLIKSIVGNYRLFKQPLLITKKSQRIRINQSEAFLLKGIISQRNDSIQKKNVFVPSTIGTLAFFAKQCTGEPIERAKIIGK